jgi:hypothetical protein
MDEVVGSRVRLEYFDQNEAFASYLPVSGRVSKRCVTADGPDDWYLVELDEPLDYQLKVGPKSQFRRIIVPRVLIRSRLHGEPISRETSPSVFLLLVGDGQDVPAQGVSVEDYIHVCWARCYVNDAA